MDGGLQGGSIAVTHLDIERVHLVGVDRVLRGLPQIFFGLELEAAGRESIQRWCADMRVIVSHAGPPVIISQDKHDVRWRGTSHHSQSATAEKDDNFRGLHLGQRHSSRNRSRAEAHSNSVGAGHERFNSC